MEISGLTVFNYFNLGTCYISLVNAFIILKENFRSHQTRALELGEVTKNGIESFMGPKNYGNVILKMDSEIRRFEFLKLRFQFRADLYCNLRKNFKKIYGRNLAIDLKKCVVPLFS